MCRKNIENKLEKTPLTIFHHVEITNQKCSVQKREVEYYPLKMVFGFLEQVQNYFPNLERTLLLVE